MQDTHATRRPRPWGPAAMLLLVLAACLAGCGGGGDDPDQPTPDVDCTAQPARCR